MNEKLMAAPPRPGLRLSRSNSNASVLGLKESPYPQHLYISPITKKSVIDELENSHLGPKQSSRDLHDHVPLLHPVPITLEQRQSRISQLLKEAKKEKPLGKSQLFKMTLTFRSFVWEPTLYNIYGTPLSQSSKILETEKVEAPLSAKVKKSLVRSNSATSLKSNHNILLNVKSIENPEEPLIGISQRSVRKDLVKLSMLTPTSSPTNNDVKIKNQKGNNFHQSDLPTQRSLKLGAIPRYLTSRKAEWARQEEEKIKNMPDPDCPPGHVAMSENERMETLQKLKKNHQELIEEYNCLPVSKDTLRVRQKKEDIEKQLIKVEEGIRVLSKPKVFVRIDDPKETSS